MNKRLVIIGATTLLTLTVSLLLIPNYAQQKYTDLVLQVDKFKNASARTLSYESDLLSATAITELTALPSPLAKALGLTFNHPLYVKTNINYLAFPPSASHSFFTKQKNGNNENIIYFFPVDLKTQLTLSGQISYSGAVNINMLAEVENDTKDNMVEINGLLDSSFNNVDFQAKATKLNINTFGKFQMSGQNIQLSYTGKMLDCTTSCNSTISLRADRLNLGGSEESAFMGLSTIVESELINGNNKEEIRVSLNSTADSFSRATVLIHNFKINGAITEINPARLTNAVINITKHNTSGSFFKRKAWINNTAQLLNGGFRINVIDLSGTTKNGGFTSSLFLTIPIIDMPNLIRNPLGALSELKASFNAEASQSDIDMIAGVGTAQKLYSQGLVRKTSEPFRLKSEISVESGVATINGKELSL